MSGEERLSPYFRDVEKAKENWGWFITLGFLLMALGAAVIYTSFSSSLFSVILFGLLVIAAGVVQILQAFLARRWSGFLLSLLLGVLYIVTGFICAARPETAPISLALWIAAFCFVVGLFKMLSSFFLKFEKWGWVCFNGLITFLLGIFIYIDWPISGMWVIGLFVGVDMILSGWSWLLLALSARKA